MNQGILALDLIFFKRVKMEGKGLLLALEFYAEMKRKIISKLREGFMGGLERMLRRG